MSAGKPERTFARRDNRFRSRDLGAAAAVLASAAPASATVLWQDGLSWNVGDSFDLILGDPASTIDLTLSFSMGGEADLGLDAPTGMASSSTVQFSFFNVGMGGGNHYLTLFSPGDTVDGSLSFNSEGLLINDDALNPDWTVGATGYAGFVFDPGTGPLYGYAQVRFDSPSELTVLSWAYQDDGSAIQVPEPTLFLLLGLGGAVLALGVPAWRRARAPNASDA